VDLSDIRTSPGLGSDLLPNLTTAISSDRSRIDDGRGSGRGTAHLADVTVTGRWQGDLASAALASSTRLVELDTTAWTINTVRVMARNISPSAAFDLGAATFRWR
jgi:hypothetical protein